MERALLSAGLIIICLLLSSWRQQIGHVAVATSVTGGDPCSGKSIGQTCSGTSAVYMGTFNGTKYMVTPSGCTDSSTPTCAGGTDTVTKFWEGDPGLVLNGTDILTMPNVDDYPFRSPQLGDAGSAGMLGSSSVSAGSAAHYCDAMTYGGYSDWYLPSKSEMAYMYCHLTPTATHTVTLPDEDPNCATYGGKTSDLTGFQDLQYWTSTEKDGPGAWRQYVGNGNQGWSNKNNAYGVRCIRRYDTTIGSSAPTLVQMNLLSFAAATLSSITTPKAPTVGNTIIVAAAGRASTHTITTITGCGATFTQIARTGVTNCEAEIWAGVCTTTGSTFSIASNVSLLRAFEILEFNNLTGARDGTAAATNQNSFTNTTGNVTTTRANTVLVAAGSMDKAATQGTGPTNSFIDGGVVGGGGGGNIISGYFAYKPVNATGTYSTGWGLTGSGSPNSCTIFAAIY